jgi:hypothetical protein
MWHNLLTSTLAWVPPDELDRVDRFSGSLEKGGLYFIASVLAFSVFGLFLLRERQATNHAIELGKVRDEYQTKLLSVVEKQTSVLTQVAHLQESVEHLLERIARHLAETHKE